MSIQKAQEARTEKILSRPVRYEGRILTRKELVHELLSRGYCLDESDVPRIKEMSRLQFNRATLVEQQRHERRMAEAGNKKLYTLKKPLSSGGFTFVELTKTEYDYARSII